MMPRKLKSMIKKYWNKRAFVIFALIGFLFGFFQLTSHELAERGNVIWTGAYAARLLFVCALIGSVVGGLCSVFSMRLLGSGYLFEADGDEKKIMESGWRCYFCGRKVWKGRLVSWALIVLCWLPAYLAYYPGICAYDTTIQLGQVESGAYNDHHPIAHTLLLDSSMELGERFFQDVNTGLALLVFAQMALLAAVFSWAVILLATRGVKVWIVLGLQLFAMVHPFHMYMSVSVCKDVFFSVFFLLQMLALCEMIRRREHRFEGYDFLFVVSSVGMQLFRNNGRYAMLVLMVILLFAMILAKGKRRFWGKVILSCGGALLVGSLCISGLFKNTGAEQGDRREMLSMPIQQLARCMIYHGGVGVVAEDDASMSPEEIALINDFLLNESYREYRPDIADPVKRHTNTYVVRYRTGDFLKTYLELLKKYPGDFVNAVLAVNAGYLYVDDVSHAYINVNGKDTGLGYVQTRFLTEELNSYGIYQDSKWETHFDRMEQWADANAYLKIPVLKYLFVPGVVLWLYLLIVGYLLMNKRYAESVPFALVLGYYLTMFFGPTVQLRYIYPLMIILPFAALMSVCKGGSKELENEQSE